ncbi:ABC transporter ATP-binding protein [Guggenheimella bovis]
MIEIKNISLKYPGANVFAIKDLSLTMNSGEFFGLLGPNGAGKTTLIKLLSTLLTPNSGEIVIDGKKISRTDNQTKRKLSMITQEYSLRSNMTPLEIMELQGRLYGMKKSIIKEKTAELLEFVDLYDHRQKICRKLSGGMKRKLMLCRGLLTNPEILILDEPTVGLDPFARRQMWDLLKKLNESGMTILLTTHYIDEAEYLCERVALIEKGNCQRIDSPKVLISEIGKVAVDSFNGDSTSSSFFKSHELALQYASTLQENFVIRNTTLEDVFISQVGKCLEARS